MGLQGYVGDASDARKLRALESKRAADREALEKAKLEAEKSGSGKTALREFGQGESEAAEAVFKAGTVGLVTREQFLATKEKAEAAAREAAAEEKKSAHAARKLKTRAAGRRALDPALDDQFATGRLYASITSRPGQCGRCDGAVLEGKELEFYIKKMARKKSKV